MAENLLRLISEAKPQAILLTSFTFGISYFEASILPALLSNGCSNVSVLVDEGQYLHSLGETHSSFAGRSYRICPISSPGGGIFHPKLAYMKCEGYDLLVVSSGNLTFSGQGGNLECIDCVQSNETPLIFEDVATFFRDLSHAVSSSSAQAAHALHQYSEEATRCIEKMNLDRSPENRSSWLVHTLARSASDQLAEILPAMSDGFKRLTVMSPYHAPDASPIVSIAKKIGVNEIELALDPKHLSIALDEKRLAKQDGVSISYVLKAI